MNDDIERQLTLLELLDRAVDKGVVLTGDVTLSVAGVDLIYLSLRLLLATVENTRPSEELVAR
jgi:hypothetical protein